MAEKEVREYNPRTSLLNWLKQKSSEELMLLLEVNTRRLGQEGKNLFLFTIINEILKERK